MFQYHTLLIFRGLPGSGKSSVAEALLGGKVENIFESKSEFRFKMCKTGFICTTDAYFYKDWKQEKDYEFSKNDIGHYHQKNKRAVEYGMQKGYHCIGVDNTNTTEWEMKPYFKLAKQYGYKIVIIEVPHVSLDICEERNTHSVPRDALEAMENRWEQVSVKGTEGKLIEASAFNQFMISLDDEK